MGTQNRRAQIAEIQVLAPDTVLVAASTLMGGPLGAPGPLAGEQLGIVTLSTGAVRPCRMNPMPSGIANAVAGDLRWAYVALFDGTSRTDLWKVDCIGALPPTLLVTLPNEQINNLELDAAGRLLAIGNRLYTIDPVIGTILGSCPMPANAFACETVTGMVAGVDGHMLSQAIWWAPQCAARTTVQVPPPGGWGTPGGIAVMPDPVAYGNPTPSGGPQYRWQLAPNPGGLPIAGTIGFALQIDRRDGPRGAGVWLLSPGSAHLPIPGLGLDLLLDPRGLMAGFPIPAGTGQIVFDIPSGLTGLSVFFQTVHVHGSQLAASEGVRLTIL